VLLITVIATALGALVARGVYTDPPPVPPPVVQPSPSAVPPEDQPGPADVQGTADATAHPLYRTLQPLLQTYFDAINEKDYARWTGTVTDERRAQQSEDKWRADYRTTRDGSIVIYRIEARGDGAARVLVQFTSTQVAEDAPPELPAACIHWNVVWAVAMDGGQWKLAAGTSSATPKHEECSA
jgi:hypothetical protein